MSNTNTNDSAVEKTIFPKLLIGSVAFILISSVCLYFIHFNPIVSQTPVPPLNNKIAAKTMLLEITDVIILISSEPSHENNRDTIRQTWLELINKPKIKFFLKYYFVIGDINVDQDEHNTTSEEEEHDDIVYLPTFEGKEYNAYKTAAMFKWLYQQYKLGQDFKYVLKTNDESFIVLDKLLEALNDIKEFYLSFQGIESKNKDFISWNVQRNQLDCKFRENRELYWGYFSGNKKRDDQDWIISDNYPPFAYPGAYILSKNLMLYIARNLDYLRYYNSEDVSVGAWLAPVNNIVRIHDVRFDTEYKSRGCQNTYLIVHNISVDTMKQLYSNLRNLGRLCDKEHRTRGEYLYNWAKPPSKCCDVLI